MNANSNVVIIGLPGSGKTTLLAAIWHMVRESGSVTKLKFDGLSQGNYEHLNELAKRWRAGKRQERTQTNGAKVVVMRLRTEQGRSVQLSFPDMPGEDFSGMWEKREVEQTIVDMLKFPSVVLTINGDTIKFPAWIVEQMAIVKGTKLPIDEARAVDWSAHLAPTQVQVVELLQFLMTDDLFIGPRRLSVLISAWDEVSGEELEPNEILKTKLPLLFQYLDTGRDPWTWKVWGISAQGGVYEDQGKNEHFVETDTLRDLDRASDRIKVVDGKSVSTDITLPLDWLIDL